jgi:DNA-binding response OmpR family regulator
MDALELKNHNKKIKLNRQQEELLSFFIENRNKLLVNEVIEQKIWSDKVVQDTTRIALISKLRAKLNGKFIVTSHCLGYIFKM